MNNELKKLIERFEVEVWLYIDGSLNKEEKEFWDKKLKLHGELRNILDNTSAVLNKYDGVAEVEISDTEVDRIIEQLPEPATIRFSLSNFFGSFFSSEFTAVKLATASVLSVAALVILLTTDKPNAVKKFGDDILSWRGNSINSDINQIDNSIETLSMEEWEKYKYIQNRYDEWEQSFYKLNYEIEKMKQDVGDTSL